ncbi:MAG: hypothetical protein HY062_11285 [Bacteroidetes bacterium]|nr:hypothetical protein [Bacteroidota bacterium]
MQNIKTRFITHTVFFFLVYALMFYIVLRALNLVMTHDEAYSFYNVKHFWWVETLCTGNTHWFNFLAIKMAVMLGFEKASQLRWFSLLSSGVFLTVVYFWIKSLKDIPTKVFAFSFLLLNPFLVDYLSLARGYSTGLMFQSVSMLCYYIAVQKRNRGTATLALFCAGMAAIANFNFFYFFVAFSILYFLKYHFKQDFQFLKNKLFYLESVFALGITCTVVKALQFITTCSNDIGAYGGENLVESVFSGYVYTLVYHAYELPGSVIICLAYALFIVILITSVYGIWFSKKHRIGWYRFSSSVLLLMLGLCVFNKWCFGVLYPMDRTALMFYPLLALVLTGFFKSLLPKNKVKNALLYMASAILTFHFLCSVNITRTFDYWQQSDTKACFVYLDSIGAKKVGIAPELFGVYRNYYQLTEKQAFKFEGISINTAFPEGFDGTGKQLQELEYLVLFPPYNLSFYRKNTLRLKGINYYKNSGTLVVQILP